jgi:CubicO group peptidase (beta-lactamase class C family)
MNQTLSRIVRLGMACAAVGAVVAAQSDNPKLDFDKVNEGRMLIDPYSYWQQPYSYYYFHHIDQIPKQRLDWVRKPATPFTLKEPTGTFEPTYTVNGQTWSLDEYLKQADVTGFLILKDDQIVYEKYLHGAVPDDRFISFSMHKSITSVLVGVAVSEGRIKSVDDPVTNYLPELKNTTYKDVTIKNLLQMATGVRYDEEYRNPTSDVHRVVYAWIRGDESFLSMIAAFAAREPERKPGTQFDYQSIDTQVLSAVLAKVVGMPVHQYTEEKLWKKIGAQSDAFIFQSEKQPDTCGFGCFNATVRDWARFGLMAMNYGQIGGTRIVDDRWIRDSTTPPSYNNGYGYQWWLNANSPDRAFRAVGIYGQTIYINPAKHVVVVQLSARPSPSGGGGGGRGRGGPAATPVPPVPFDAIAAKLE